MIRGFSPSIIGLTRRSAKPTGKEREPSGDSPLAIFPPGTRNEGRGTIIPSRWGISRRLAESRPLQPAIIYFTIKR